ncbi:MAG: hypothetical protein AAF705_05090 [Bacteroidota bacterium]
MKNEDLYQESKLILDTILDLYGENPIATGFLEVLEAHKNNRNKLEIIARDTRTWGDSLPKKFQEELSTRFDNLELVRGSNYVPIKKIVKQGRIKNEAEYKLISDFLASYDVQEEEFTILQNLCDDWDDKLDEKTIG